MSAKRAIFRFVPVLAAATLVAGLAGPASAVAASPAPARTGSIGVRLLPQEGVADDQSPYIRNTLAPGAAVQRQIAVVNNTPSTVHLALYAAAASIEKGIFAFGPDRAKNSATSYTSVTPGIVDLEAGKVALTTVDIRPPASAAPGEQYEVIWAETRSDPSPTTKLVAVNRVGVRVYLSLAGAGSAVAVPDFTLTGLKASRAADGHRLITALVKNTGGRALDLSGRLNLSDGPAGLAIGPFPTTGVQVLAIGASAPVQVLLDKALPAGPWKATMVMTSGALQRSISAQFSFPDLLTASSYSWSGPLPLWAVGFSFLLLFLIALVAFRFWIARRRRNERERQDDQSLALSAGRQNPGEALT